MLHLTGVLTPEQVAHCHAVLSAAEWVDGGVTAGEQSGRAKHNLQVPEDSPAARDLGDFVLKALAANPYFMSAALPLRVYPPLFNRYAGGMSFGLHIDNAVRHSPLTGVRYRTDLSCTLFLSDPDQYDGGELVVGDGYAPQRAKLPAGDMLLYSAGAVHHVEPVTRGERWASFFWVHSMVADAGQRSLLYDLDRAITLARGELGDDHSAAVALVAVYHNLVRAWSQV
jgi:PKHD-type hydroxylase